MYLWGSEVSCCSSAAFCFGELFLGGFVFLFGLFEIGCLLS